MDNISPEATTQSDTIKYNQEQEQGQETPKPNTSNNGKNESKEYKKKLKKLEGLELPFKDIPEINKWYNNNKASLESCDTLKMFKAIEFNEKVAKCCSDVKSYEELKKLKDHPGASEAQKDLLTNFTADSIKIKIKPSFKKKFYKQMSDLEWTLKNYKNEDN